MNMNFKSLTTLVAAVAVQFAAWGADTRPIGVMDSGVGGLTVLERLLQHPGLAGERFSYAGDQANMPYGNYAAEGRTESLRRLIVRMAHFLTSDGYYLSPDDSEPKGEKTPAKIVIVACNTATAYGLGDSTAAFLGEGSRAKVIGIIEAGARGAIDRLRLDRATGPVSIGVLATPGTIASGAYERAILAELARRGCTNEVKVVTESCEGLADAIEFGLPDADRIARESLVALVRRSRESGCPPLATVILGCTHYPFKLETLCKTRDELGARFDFTDPAVLVAEECHAALESAGMLSDGAGAGPRLRCFFSVKAADSATRFTEVRGDRTPGGSLAQLLKLLPSTARLFAEGRGR